MAGALPFLFAPARGAPGTGQVWLDAPVGGAG
jgi:hypothetical protein